MNSESLEPNGQTSKQKRQANKRIDSMISYVTTVGAACLILMWSVFNIWLNVLQFFAANAKQADVVLQTGEAEPVWWITCLMVFLTAVVPFLLGLFLLFKTVKSSARKTR